MLLKYYRKVPKTGPKCRKRFFLNTEMARDTAKDKCTAASKVSSNFSREEYRHSFRIKRRGVSPSHTMVGFVLSVATAKHLLSDSAENLHMPSCWPTELHLVQKILF